MKYLLTSREKTNGKAEMSLQLAQIVSQVQALRFQLVFIISNTRNGPQTDIKRLLCPKVRKSICAETLHAFPPNRCRGRYRDFWANP